MFGRTSWGWARARSADARRVSSSWLMADRPVTAGDRDAVSEAVLDARAAG
jgi:hypothetical protein